MTLPMTLLSYRLVQRGPSIIRMIDAWIDREQALTPRVTRTTRTRAHQG